MCAVDCVDFPFVQILIPDLERPGKLTWNTSLNSEKLCGPGLCYECAWSIIPNDIVHLSGPWLPGDWNDIETGFNRIKRFNCTKSKLKCKGDPGEKWDKHEMMITACVVITQIEQELGIKVLYDTETDGYEYETYERKIMYATVILC